MFDIGIIGGMGPQACLTLFDLIIKNTVASKDQEHPSIVIINDTKIPDRSDFILGHSKANPVKQINNDVDLLFTTKAHVIGIACNTSHYFYDQIKKSQESVILNMPELTLKYCQKRGCKRIVLFSTLGTITSRIYENKSLCDAEIIYPKENEARLIHKIIYDIKSSPSDKLEVFANKVQSIIDLILKRTNSKEGTMIVLGCTELSILTPYLRNKCDFEMIDPLELLAYSLISKSGYKCKPNNYYDFNLIGEINAPSK